MTGFTIGIDTGGTYTDAVIVDAEHHRVIAKAKALTSRGDLAIGVTEALGRVLGEAGSSFDPASVSYVSLSTTLATNALVEGRGDDVMTFLVGFDDDMVASTRISEVAPGTKIVRVDGGHDHTGEERAALDCAAVTAALAGQVAPSRAYAVAAYYSVRNSSHERQVQALVQAATGCPATISSDLSALLDAPCRALTATLNARIISLITALQSAVRASMRQLDIDAPIMIVKGDGSLAPADAVVLKPIETILSGPAASVIGARFLCGEPDFVLVDIGGTTSDVATVRNGWPRLEESGSKVGGLRTLVRAVDIHTSGLGGDSEVLVDLKGEVALGTQRVVPISLLAHAWPQVMNELESALKADRGMLSAFSYGVRPQGAADGAAVDNLSTRERQFLSKFSHGQPVLLRDAVNGAADLARLRRAVASGLLQVSGFTPSDAAHVLGLQSQWSKPAALAACELMGRANGRVKGAEVLPQLQALARDVCDELARKSSWLLLEQLAGEHFDENDALLRAVAGGRAGLNNLGLAFQPLIPVVAVGGPAPVFFPEVGRRLNTEVIIPAHSEVANAIGAAVGMIKARVVVEVRGNDLGFLVYHGAAPEFVSTGKAALDRAITVAREAVKNKAKSLGGHEVSIEVSVSRVDIPDMDEAVSLVAATVTAEAVSEPTGAD